jgi:hypothetical protein
MGYTFTRWMRSGLAASLGAQPQTSGSARRPKLTMGVEVSGEAIPQPQVATVDLDVLGPGDVRGIDERQVIRTFPVPGTLDFEPSYHAHVEFDRHDLPWLFTPFGPAGVNTLRPWPFGRGVVYTLRPWITLVVVEQGADAKLEPTLPLPTLTVTGPEVAELPALDQAHAWAHTQITGDTSAGAEEIANNEPERILSRLICPRVLDPDKAYIACVVPTFAIGALGGLGAEVPDTLGVDAWSGTEASVSLPVYYSWEFSTAGEGDFRSLVLRLKQTTHLDGVGTRDLDVTRPGFGLAPRPTVPNVPLGGVLAVDAPAAAPVDPGLAAQVEPLVNEIEKVAPPIYGRWHAAATEVHETDPGWLAELNLDVRYRVAAGLGTQVVKERQEDLMAAAWEQLHDVLAANQLLRQAQLGVAGSKRVLARHLSPLPNAYLLAIAGPALARIRADSSLTVWGAAARSCLPVLALSGAFRRVARVRGPIERRLGLPQRTGRQSFPDLPPPPAIDLAALLPELASGALAAPAPKLPDGAVPLPSKAGVRWRGGRPPLHGPFSDPGGDSGPLEELGPAFATLASRATQTACTPLDLGSTATAVRTALNPDVAVAGRARDRVSLPASSRVVLSHRLDPVMAAPEIPTPMIRPLHELGTDWLLPGLGNVPPDTVTLVEPDPQMIEAYMVGLNHEIARELLWRGFPTDQRGTVFARFWDRQGAVASTAAPLPDRDIPDLHTWDAADELGTHLGQGRAGLVVLLIRGALLQRYPRATIYMRHAHWRRGSHGMIVFDGSLAEREPAPLADDHAWDTLVRFPTFTTRVGADTTLLGFQGSPAEVHGMDRDKVTPRTRDTTAGWYFVFEEQPTEPRFGPTGATLPAAADLRSDDLASTLLRPAFRLFVHGSDLVSA